MGKTRNSVKNLSNTRAELLRADKKKRLTETARDMAVGIGLRTAYLHDTFGRTLPYYAPILHVLRKHGGNLGRKRLLHMGSSFGIFTRYLQSKNVNAVALDLDNLAVNLAKRLGNKRVVRGDAGKLPFAQNSFDFFVSDHFLFSGYNAIFGNHPSQNMELGILKSLRDSLKPKGIGIIKYDTQPFGDIVLKGQNLFAQARIVQQKFTQLMNENGFEVLEINPRESLVVIRKK